MEHDLVSLYLTHLLLQLQLAELDYRDSERKGRRLDGAWDLVIRRGDEFVRGLKSVCSGGKVVLVQMSARLELPHSVRGVESICDRHVLVYRPLDNESRTFETFDLMLASLIEVPELGRADSRFLTEAAFHEAIEDEA